MTASRKDVRNALGALLKASVTKAKEVFSYQETTFAGKSPVVVVNSSGSSRDRMTLRGSFATFRFDVHVFVLQRTKDGSWFNQQAEDLIDDIEQQICQAVDDNQRSDHWQAIRYAAATDASQPATIEGHIYLYEVISLEVEALR